MRDAEAGFFVVMAVLFPFVLLMWAVHWLLGIFALGMVAGATYNTEQQDWAQLGAKVDTRVITVAVLIGGTLLILAQLFG